MLFFISLRMCSVRLLGRVYTWTYHVSLIAEGRIRRGRFKCGSAALFQCSKVQVTPVVSQVNLRGTGKSPEYFQPCHHDNYTHYFCSGFFFSRLFLLIGLLIDKIPYIHNYLRSAIHDRMNVFLSNMVYNLYRLWEQAKCISQMFLIR